MEKLSDSNGLQKSLNAWMLWGLGVGYVISGMYFGWNLGLPVGGTLGLGLATLFISLMYVTFTFSYAELACAIPKAGGAFDYVKLAFGKEIGFLAGIAQSIEFVFAPPAIAAAIGAYFNLFLPFVPTILFALIAYLIFTGLNIYGVKAAARFELIITILAVFELILFAVFTFPSFEYAHLTKNYLPNGYLGIFGAIPFAIWFFLGIEGLANVSEETIHPQRNILLGFGSAILTLVILAFLTFFSAIGVAGWEAIVYLPNNQQVSDSPLPLALGKIVGNQHILYHLLVSIGLFGLVASFHGIILAAGRAVYEMGREQYIYPWLGKINKKFGTPANALIFNMLLGVLALFTGRTADIITLAVFGALTLYIVSMLALFRLRKIAPDMNRPFRVPFYPIFPGLALIIAVIALLSVTYFNLILAGIYFGMIILAYIGFNFYAKKQKLA